MSVKTLVCLGGPLHNQTFKAGGNYFKHPVDLDAMRDTVNGMVEFVEYEAQRILFTQPGGNQWEREYWVFKGTTDEELKELLNNKNENI